MVDITLEYSRPFRALKLWLAFRAHGAQAFREAVEDNLRQARLLYDLVVAPRLPRAAVRAAAALDRPFPPSRLGGSRRAERLNAGSSAGSRKTAAIWVAPATIDGKVGLRPCFVNFRTTDDDVRALVEIAVELGA